MNSIIAMAKCKTAVTPLLMQWSYCSLVLSCWYIFICTTKSCSTVAHISTLSASLFTPGQSFNNSLAPGRCGSNFKSINLKLIIQNSSLGTPCKIALMWMSQNLNNEKYPLVQINAWCYQATRHHLSQWWPRTMALLGHIETAEISFLGLYQNPSYFIS